MNINNSRPFFPSYYLFFFLFSFSLLPFSTVLSFSSITLLSYLSLVNPILVFCFIHNLMTYNFYLHFSFILSFFSPPSFSFEGNQSHKQTRMATLLPKVTTTKCSSQQLSQVICQVGPPQRELRRQPLSPLHLFLHLLPVAPFSFPFTPLPPPSTCTLLFPFSSSLPPFLISQETNYLSVPSEGSFSRHNWEETVGLHITTVST